MEINKEYILELSRGLFQLQESEKRKLEFKRQWYDLSGGNKQDEEEFCKDVAAMANTPGPNGFIIIGLDESRGQLTNSPISASGMTDIQITNLIIKKVRPSIQFEIDTITISENQNKVISVIKIPPSLEKPHVIGKYLKYDGTTIKNEIQNYIPIRNGTQIFPANHVDLEYMFYDKKNVIPDYRVDFLPIKQKITFQKRNENDISRIAFDMNFILQNSGRYPIAISNAELQMHNIIPPLNSTKDPVKFIGIQWMMIERNLVGHIYYSLPGSPVVLGYNTMQEIKMSFKSEETKKNTNLNLINIWESSFNIIEHYKYSITLNSVNNRTFVSDTWEVQI